MQPCEGAGATGCTGIIENQPVNNVEKLTIDQIAKMAYVSRSVVSRVLNNHSNVSDEARQRVMHVIEKYNYMPSAAARSLVTNRSYEISVLVPRKADEVLANGYWSLLLLGITEGCRQRGYLVSLSMIGNEQSAEINRRILAGHHFDGYMMVSKEVVSLIMPSVRQRQLPALLIGNHPQHPELSFVDVDNSEGAYKAASYLIGLGHREVATIAGPLCAQESRDRLAGFKRAHREYGLPISPDYVVEGEYTERSGYAAMQRLLALPCRPTAVFCMNDAMATGGLLAIHDAGLHVPSDVSVVGYDDLPASAYTMPPLSTLRQPIRRMGYVAAGHLIDQVEGNARERVRVKLSAELIVRRSCGRPQGA